MRMPEKPENELTEQARQSIEELKVTIRQEVFSEQKRQRRGQLIYAGLGIVIGVAVSAALFQWWDTIAKIQPLLVGVLVVSIVAIGGAAVAFIWFRDSIFGKFFKAGVASYEAGIENATQTFVPLLTKLLPKLDAAELQTGIDALKKSGLQIAAYFAYIRARRMVFGWLVALAAGLAAFLGTTLLVKQNELLREQTALAKQQAYLTEAARRSSYVMLMDNILNQVNEELKGADTTPYHPSRRLSTVTIGRIAALSQSLRPIRYLVEGDTLSRYLSPERGQLLLALVYSRLDTIHTYPEIYAKSDFSFADLQMAKLDSAFLRGVNLVRANLFQASLIKANLMGASLWKANLFWAQLQEANLCEIYSQEANLQCASCFEANLYRADLKFSNLLGASFWDSNLKEADLSFTNLGEMYVEDIDLPFGNVKNFYSGGTNFEGADMRGINLEGGALSNDSLNWPSFSMAKVSLADFESWRFVQEQYHLDTIIYKDMYGTYYLILPKNK